jgi:hypothetical protein
MENLFEKQKGMVLSLLQAMGLVACGWERKLKQFDSVYNQQSIMMKQCSLK